MKDESTGIFKLLELFERWSGRQKQAKVKKDRARVEALEALLAAVTETTAYRADRRDGGQRNRDRERTIYKLWSRAAILVHSLDKRLSRILAMNSLGWADPEFWETAAFKKVAVELDRIRDQCLFLLDHD